MMLTTPDEVVTSTLFNAIAVVGRQISKVARRLSDTPETDPSRARDAVRRAMTVADPNTARLAEVLADRNDSQICSLSASMIAILCAIERHTAALADEGRRRGAWHAIELLEAGT